MKELKLLLVLLMFFMICFPSFSQPDIDESMKLAGPTAEHDVLKKLDGNWQVKCKYDFGGGMTMEGTGSAKGLMILGGRFMNFEQISESMGMKIASISILGFDRRINKYTYYGIDEMGTYSVTGEGDLDANTKILTLNGKTMDPAGKSLQMQEYKFVFDFSKESEVKCDVVFKMPDNTEKAVVQIWYTKI